jgi:hypothetical protein
MSSWLSKNYEKASVGGAAVAALGLAFLGWLKVGGVQEDFSTPTKGEGKNDPAVVEAPRVAKAASSLARKLAWPQGETSENRAVDLFTGIPLFIRREAPETAFDLLKSEPVHPPIPNTWWIEHRLDPGFGDSPTRDPDGEGFTNLEEFEGKTNPADAKSHPPFIGKLKFHEDESVQWVIRPSYPESGGCPFTYNDTKNNKNKTVAGKPVMPGELFFAAGGAEAAQNRFKFIGLEERDEMNRGLGIQQKVTYAKVEDQKPNKKGTVYEFKIAFPTGDAEKWAKFDRNAVLSLEAAGNEGKNESIEEFTRFGLPFDSPNKDYLLKKVTPDEIEVEHTDPKTGEKTLFKASKGGFPTKAS